MGFRVSGPPAPPPPGIERQSQCYKRFRQLIVRRKPDRTGVLGILALNAGIELAYLRKISLPVAGDLDDWPEADPLVREVEEAAQHRDIGLFGDAVEAGLPVRFQAAGAFRGKAEVIGVVVVKLIDGRLDRTAGLAAVERDAAQ